MGTTFRLLGEDTSLGLLGAEPRAAKAFAVGAEERPSGRDFQFGRNGIRARDRNNCEALGSAFSSAWTRFGAVWGRWRILRISCLFAQAGSEFARMAHCRDRKEVRAVRIGKFCAARIGGSLGPRCAGVLTVFKISFNTAGGMTYRSLGFGPLRHRWIPEGVLDVWK